MMEGSQTIKGNNSNLNISEGKMFDHTVGFKTMDRRKRHQQYYSPVPDTLSARSGSPVSAKKCHKGGTITNEEDNMYNAQKHTHW
jgi:hypothetical protein